MIGPRQKRTPKPTPFPILNSAVQPVTCCPRWEICGWVLPELLRPKV